MRVDRCPAGVIDRAWATEAAPIASETLAAGSPASVDRLVVRMSTVVSVSSHSPVIIVKTCQKAPAQRPTSTSPVPAPAAADERRRRWNSGASATRVR